MIVVAALPSDWTCVLDPLFAEVSGQTGAFHDAGFFGFDMGQGRTEILLNPLYFGEAHGYRYQGLDACAFRLELVESVDPARLAEAAEAFEIMRIVVAEGSIVFDFGMSRLDLKIRAAGSDFRLLTLGEGQDYWTKG